MKTEKIQSDLIGQLKRLNATLSIIGRASAVLVHAQSENDLYAGVCAAITSSNGNFPLAWIGVPIEDDRKSIAMVASSGTAQSYLDGIEVTWDDSPLGEGPSGRSIRTGEVQFNNNMLSNDQFGPWKERAINFDLKSSLTLPIKLSDGTVAAALMVYSHIPEAFGSEELALLQQLGLDIGYGVDALRTHVAYERELATRLQHQNTISELLEASIAVLSNALEMRDPYTAGHGRRVAALAVALAQALGMDEDRIRGVHLASMVHDIGKIRIPLEILIYPGKLSVTEHTLIQSHPTHGYELLRSIRYPWPIAQAVWQHHERLDGSGYPNGLKGDQIILEARIIAVADVVESMSSHRPYRAALGIEIALQEISRLSPDKLDPEVVDACIKIFHSGKFSFSSNN